MPKARVGFRSTVEQRRKIRELCDFLRSDLYKREGGTEMSAIWRSPLGWEVEYGHNDDGVTSWCVIRQPDGRDYASNDLVTLFWLEETLP